MQDWNKLYCVFLLAHEWLYHFSKIQLSTMNLIRMRC
jgi:hypothetical protein